MEAEIEKAQRIVNLVVNLFATRKATALLQVSQLCGHSIFEVHRSFSLVIAIRRQINTEIVTWREECFDYASKAGTLVTMLASPFHLVPDEVAKRLLLIPCESSTNPYNPARAQVLNDYVALHPEEEDPNYQRWLRLEALDSFNAYCWEFDISDSSYWKNVIERLGSGF